MPSASRLYWQSQSSLCAREIPPTRVTRFEGSSVRESPSRSSGMPGCLCTIDGNSAAASSELARRARRPATTSPEGIASSRLTPDPGINRYRLVLDIRHVGSAGGPPANPDRSWVGPYFAHSVTPTADGRPVHTVFGATFSDTHPNRAADVPPKGQLQNVVRFRAAAISLRPSRDPGLHQRVIPPPLLFVQSANLTGEWRTFRIEVTPDGVSVEWRQPDGAFVPVCKLQGEPVSDAYGELQRVMNRDEPGSGVVVPPWTPRMPLGIWSFRAGVSLKNVVISPL